jgi:hypothetical protein
MRVSDVHSSAALLATNPSPLPPELQAAVRDLVGEQATSSKFKRSSKIHRLMEVRSPLRELAIGMF